MSTFSLAQEFLKQKFVRTLVHKQTICLTAGEAFCYDMSWKVSDDLYVHRRVQENGLNKTILFIKKVGVIQLYELAEDGFNFLNYLKVSLSESESTDYRKNVCSPDVYKGDGLGGILFSLVLNERCRRRVEITKRGECFCYEVDCRRQYY